MLVWMPWHTGWTRSCVALPRNGELNVLFTMVFDGFIPLSSSCTCSLCQAEMAKKTMSYTKLVSSLKVKRKHNVQLLCRNSVPYSGKLSREKAFVNFAVLWLFMKVFSVKFGAWHSLVRHKWAIRETFLRKSYFSPIHKSFFPLKVSHYTVWEKKKMKNRQLLEIKPLTPCLSC